jgi:CubicO group peptidase (beta-lactamase class C family)
MIPSLEADDRIAAALGAFVDAEELAGAATSIWREGGGVDVTCVGWRDVEGRLPMARDTIFRLASMSKPITSAAALILLEEGRFALEDPISRWAPELSQMRVLRSPHGPLDRTAPVARPITFSDLLTHRAGLIYAGLHGGPLGRAYDEALGGDIDSEVAPDAWIEALAALPLVAQPGSAFHYGRSTDLLGFLIARMEQAPLGDVLARRIFAPLGMVDTGFTVAQGKRGRRAAMYGFDGAGRLTRRLLGVGGAFLAERPDDMAYVSGGGGLWSTLDDFLLFARMFVGGGAVDGVRLLRPETLAMMTSNQLTERQRATAELLGRPAFSGHGFGLGVAVVLDPEKASRTMCRGGIGTVGWPGAFGGWWQADPTDGSVMIFLAHSNVGPDELANGIGLGVYAAIERFHTLASLRERLPVQAP